MNDEACGLRLLYSHTFREVSGLIYVAAPSYGYVVGEELDGLIPGAKARVVVGFDVRAEARTYLEATTTAEADSQQQQQKQIPKGMTERNATTAEAGFGANDKKKGNCTRSLSA